MGSRSRRVASLFAAVLLTGAVAGCGHSTPKDAGASGVVTTFPPATEAAPPGAVGVVTTFPPVTPPAPSTTTTASTVPPTTVPSGPTTTVDLAAQNFCERANTYYLGASLLQTPATDGVDLIQKQQAWVNIVAALTNAAEIAPPQFVVDMLKLAEQGQGYSVRIQDAKTAAQFNSTMQDFRAHDQGLISSVYNDVGKYC